MRAQILTTVVAVALGTSAAQAATLDFLGFTDANGETAVEGFFPNDTIFDAMFVPIATTLRGYSGDAASGKTGSGPFAYLDRNQAGVGVCKVLSGSQCAPASDDNLTKGEILGVSFGQSVTITSLSFRGESHPTDPEFGQSDLFDVSFDGGANWLSLALVNARFGNSVAVNAVLPKGTEMLLAYNNQQYYLSAMEVAPVPLPAAGLLLVAGIGALGFASRKRAV